MKFKEIEIVKGEGLFSSFKHIAYYHDYYDDQIEMIEKLSSFQPHKGDTIRVIDRNTHKDVILKVRHCFIDYLENKMTIWCK